ALPLSVYKILMPRSTCYDPVPQSRNRNEVRTASQKLCDLAVLHALAHRWDIYLLVNRLVTSQPFNRRTELQARTQLLHGHDTTFHRCHTASLTHLNSTAATQLLHEQLFNLGCHTASPRSTTHERPRPKLYLSQRLSTLPTTRPYSLAVLLRIVCVCTVTQIHYASSARRSIRTDRSALQCTWSEQHVRENYFTNVRDNLWKQESPQQKHLTIDKISIKYI
ncbi:unnamed protein product, partial [Trichogramma brassicae]